MWAPVCEGVDWIQMPQDKIHTLIIFPQIKWTDYEKTQNGIWIGDKYCNKDADFVEMIMNFWEKVK